jgi:hypothetical protein
MADTEVALTGQVDLADYVATAQAINDGHKTTLVTSQSRLAGAIEEDSDYEGCLALANEAARVEKRMETTFDAVCDLRHKLWKAATAERATFAGPWGKLKDALRDKAKRWYLEQQKAKQEAEREMARTAQLQQRVLANEAQELLDMGMVKEGRAKLMQADATVAPILPEATPKVEGARVTPKFKATCVDTISVARAIVAGEFDLMWHVSGVERPLLVVDQVVLNAIVSRMGKGLKCPGILVEDDVRFGAKKL